jgi:hypothetical protein
METIHGYGLKGVVGASFMGAQNTGNPYSGNHKGIAPTFDQVVFWIEFIDRFFLIAE